MLHTEPHVHHIAQGYRSYIKEFKLGITEASLIRCKTLLDLDQTVPKDSLFRDNLFKATCDKVQNRNEARIIRSITQYIIPSAEDLETLSAMHLEPLIERVNETWTGSIVVRIHRRNRTTLLDSEDLHSRTSSSNIFEDANFSLIYL